MAKPVYTGDPLDPHKYSDSGHVDCDYFIDPSNTTDSEIGIQWSEIALYGNYTGKTK